MIVVVVVVVAVRRREDGVGGYVLRRRPPLHHADSSGHPSLDERLLLPTHLSSILFGDTMAPTRVRFYPPLGTVFA